MDAKSVVINLPRLENVYLAKKMWKIYVYSVSHFEVFFFFPREFLTQICLINSFLYNFAMTWIILLGYCYAIFLKIMDFFGVLEKTKCHQDNSIC